MERKPPSESWESFTDRKIREAQEEGAFDALPGFGKPIADLDGPDDPNWWIKKKLREERLVLLPPVLERGSTRKKRWRPSARWPVRCRSAAL